MSSKGGHCKTENDRRKEQENAEAKGAAGERSGARPS